MNGPNDKSEGVGTFVVVISRDPQTVEHALVACAAAQAEAQVVREPEEIRRWWSEAPLTLVGSEMAPLVAGLGLPSRANVHLVGPRVDELVAWSAPLEASVLVLPEQSALLASLVDRLDEAPGEARIVAVSGGSGGVGASTFACALSQVGAARGLRAAVVDLDPLGGGLDLLVGAETAEGWRWPELSSASGHLGALSGRLPNVAGVDLVSAGRTPGEPPLEAIRSVVQALSASHQVVVLDLGRGRAPLSWPELHHLVVVGGDVRSTMAARAQVETQGLRGVEVVVRRGSGRRVEPRLVEESLGLPVVGELPDDRRVARAMEAGEPPGRGRGRYARHVGRLLDLAMTP